MGQKLHVVPQPTARPTELQAGLSWVWPLPRSPPSGLPSESGLCHGRRRAPQPGRLSALRGLWFGWLQTQVTVKPVLGRGVWRGFDAIASDSLPTWHPLGLVSFSLYADQATICGGWKRDLDFSLELICSTCFANTNTRMVSKWFKIVALLCALEPFSLKTDQL